MTKKQKNICPNEIYLELTVGGIKYLSRFLFLPNDVSYIKEAFKFMSKKIIQTYKQNKYD